MRLRLGAKSSARVQGQMKLARLLELPERDLERRVRDIESGELFRELLSAGVIALETPAHARFAARRFAGHGMRTSGEGLPELVDGKGDLAQLMLRVGQELFQECFLGEAALPDDARARLCGLTLDEVRRVRAYVDRLYVQEQFENASPSPAPESTFSAVAGIAIEDGKPVLSFFHREIWNKRYRLDAEKQKAWLSSLPARAARRTDALLRELDFIDRRKTTLYRVLEALIAEQADFLVGSDPERRRPLSQKDLAERLDISPSVLNRLIGNKCVELPWGLESPLGSFVPSRKSLLLGRLYDLARRHPGLSDEGLRAALKGACGVALSRRSIAQYRKETGLPSRRGRVGI
jgi:hypothetical protein